MSYVSLSRKLEEPPPSDAELQIEILRRLFYELEESIVENVKDYPWVISGVARTGHRGWIQVLQGQIENDGAAMHMTGEAYTFHERAAELLGCWSNAYPEALEVVLKLLHDPSQCYLGIIALSTCFECTDGATVLASFRRTDFADIKRLLSDPTLPTGILLNLLYDVCQKIDRMNGNKELERLAISHPNYALVPRES